MRPRRDDTSRRAPGSRTPGKPSVHLVFLAAVVVAVSVALGVLAESAATSIFHTVSHVVQSEAATAGRGLVERVIGR
jgi:hypothetical protein